MPTLNDQGKLAIATAVAYVPILVAALILSKRYGFKREAGWVFLFVFSIVRILGGALLPAAELITPENQSLYTAAYSLESIGLSPLLLSTLGFVQTVGGGTPFTEASGMRRIFRVLQIGCTVGLILVIIGINDQDSTNTSTQSSGNTLRRAGIVVLTGIYVVIVLLVFRLWSGVSQLMKHRRTFLGFITLALPFICVRVIYSLLSAWSADSITVDGSSDSLSEFNNVTGSWEIYLVMSVLMEYVVVLIYCFAGFRLQLNEDYKVGATEDTYPMNPQSAYSQPAYSQPAYSQPAYSQPAYNQPPYPSVQSYNV